MTGDGIVIRRVETQAEYEECVRLQDETWGAGFNERVPSTLLRISQYIGGVTAAAFRGPEAGAPMVGFVFGMTGVRHGELVHWSDMLAVRAEARDHGIGRRLKLYQRSLVKEIGVNQILWTYDPLVSRNAHLNLNILGARVIEYVSDMYGADTGSALHEAIGTDRFVVAWDVGGEAGKRGSGDVRGGEEVSGQAGTLGRWDASLEAAISSEVMPRPPHAPTSGLPRLPASPLESLIAIPGDIQEVIATAPEIAREWRESTRAAFLRHMGDGYRVTGFHRTGGSGYYRLTRAAD